MSDPTGLRKTPPPLPVRKNGSGPKMPSLPARPSPPALAGRRMSMREILSGRSFMNLVSAMQMIFSSCDFLDQQSFSVGGDSILYKGKSVASPSGDSISIPLAALGDEGKIYGCIRPRICSGELKAPSLLGLKAVPPGLFIHVSPKGFELSFPKPAEPGPVEHDGRTSVAIATIEYIDAGLKGRVKVCKENGDCRIYFSDLGWDADKSGKCDLFLVATGVITPEVRIAFEGRLALISAFEEVFISCGENFMSLCGAKKRGGKPLVSIFCGKQDL